MRDFRKLKVWHNAHKITLLVYNVTASFPNSELFGLVSQLRRSSTSIPTNIAEGCGRDSVSDFKKFFNISMGSASELEYQIFLAHEIKLIDHIDYKKLSSNIVEVKRMLSSFIKKLKADR